MTAPGGARSRWWLLVVLLVVTTGVLLVSWLLPEPRYPGADPF